MTGAEKLFTITFFAATSRWSGIYNFRTVAEAGLKHAALVISSKHRENAAEFLYSPEYAKIWTKGKPPPELSLDSMTAQMTEKSLYEFQASLDAASIVFAHSIIDNAAFEYCRIISLIAPYDWAQFIERKKIEIGETKDSTYEEIFRQKLEQYLLKEFEKQSLLKKIDRLFELCQPPAHFKPIRTYTWHRKRVEDFDNLRHDIVHGTGPLFTVPNIDEDLWYQMQTTNFLMTLVNERYGLKLDPDAVRDFHTSPQK